MRLENIIRSRVSGLNSLARHFPWGDAPEICAWTSRIIPKICRPLVSFTLSSVHVSDRRRYTFDKFNASVR